jgi:hypothetical protein
MPWLTFAIVDVLQYRRDDLRLRNPATLLLACWFACGFLFLCVAGSKLLTYSMPLFPLIAVLAGVGFRRLFNNEFTPVLRRLFVNMFRLVSVLALLGLVAMLLVLRYFLAAPSPPIAYVVGFLASAAMAAGLLLKERATPGRHLPKGLTNAADPLAGFFAIRRDTFACAKDLKPLGYKVLLELIVRCECRDIFEVPIAFRDRKLGTSKLSAGQMWLYLRHLARLYIAQFTARRMGNRHVMAARSTATLPRRESA